MDIEGAKTVAVRWPSPPLLRARIAMAEGRGLECTLEILNGMRMSGELVRFEVGAESVDVLPKGMSLQTVSLKHIRSITLHPPFELAATSEALAALVTGERSALHDHPFVVLLNDASRIAGTTRGFVKEPDGLFLFLVKASETPVTALFIPSAQIRDAQIGPVVGDTLADRAVITDDQLTRALAEQKHRPDARLGDLLVQAKLITPQQLKDALAIQSLHHERRIGDILIETGAVSLRLMQLALSEQLGIPYVDVRQFVLAPLAREALDPAFAIRNQVLPLRRTADSLVIAVENPLAIDFAQDLRFSTGLTIVAVIADPEDLKVRIAREYSREESWGIDGGSAPPGGAAVRDPTKVDRTNVEQLASQLTRETPQSTAAGKYRDTDTRVSDNTLVRLINKIIEEAQAQGASDIHIESNPGVGNTRIRFRKEGELENYLDLPPAYRSALISRIKVMAELDIAEHRRPQDGKIDFGQFGRGSIELRVAVIPTANNLEDVVLRLLGGMAPRPLDALGLSARNLAELTKMIRRSYGLILVCGPTGSGKTTTVHSLLRDINRVDMKIWTAEDPIEITQPGLRQVQVHPKIDWTFASAMRAFLRADPDVIMVGEMRDAETTKIGIEASLTGHLVFSTLHTNSAAECIVRLLDLGMDPFNFADALIGILSQRLARALCPNCKRPHRASEAEISDLLDEYCNDTKLDRATVRRRWETSHGSGQGLQLFEAVGCKLCRDGYRGRLGVYELLVSTPEIKHLMRTAAPVPRLVTAAMEGGMYLLRHDAIDKAWRGVLDLKSARTVST
jgi:type II secretory ATPase GspE/PulE/Tfp pilus assembly ATPase PilB-like protein